MGLNDVYLIMKMIHFWKICVERNTAGGGNKPPPFSCFLSSDIYKTCIHYIFINFKWRSKTTQIEV